MIKEMISGLVGTVTGLVMYPFINETIKVGEKVAPKWVHYGNHHKKTHISDAVRSRKVWIVSPTGETIIQIDYITARRIREKQGWYINIKEAKMPPLPSIGSIADLMPLLILLGFLVHSGGLKEKMETYQPDD